MLITVANAYRLCYKEHMKETATKAVRIYPSNYKKLKMFAAKKLTNLNGAVTILLKQGGY